MIRNGAVKVTVHQCFILGGTFVPEEPDRKSLKYSLHLPPHMFSDSGSRGFSPQASLFSVPLTIPVDTTEKGRGGS